MPNNLQELRSKITRIVYPYFSETAEYKITLEDVLLAIPATTEIELGYITSKKVNVFAFEIGRQGRFYQWHLGHDLDWHAEHAPETITALNGLITGGE